MDGAGDATEVVDASVGEAVMTPASLKLWLLPLLLLHSPPVGSEENNCWLLHRAAP